MQKITLSMPVYNVEQFVERALLSALNQTYPNIEFLVIDDKGSDRSMEIVKRLIETHPRGEKIRIIDHVVNKGTGATKNSAIEAATGDYIYFMDSDDEITVDCIELFYNKMMEHPVDIVVGGYRYLDMEDNTLFERKYTDCIVEGEGEMAMNQYRKNYGRAKLHTQMWNKLYRLAFIRDNDIKCVPNQLNEDNIFTTKVIFANPSCRFISDVTYLYFERVGSTVYRVRNGITERFANQLVDVSAYHKENLEKQQGQAIYPYYRKRVQFYLTYAIVSIFMGGFKFGQKMEYRSKIMDGWRFGGVVGWFAFYALLKIRFIYEIFMPKRIKQSLERS